MALPGKITSTRRGGVILAPKLQVGFFPHLFRGGPLPDLRDLFNKLKWHTGDLEEVIVTIRHRGAPRDERDILGLDIVSVAYRADEHRSLDLQFALRLAGGHAVAHERRPIGHEFSPGMDRRPP